MKTTKVCSRCGLAEKHGRVFENVSDFQLCVDCAQIAYRAKDAMSEGDIQMAISLFNEFRNGIIESIIKQTVSIWIENLSQSSAKKFITDLEGYFKNFLYEHETFAIGGLPKDRARLYLDLIGLVEGLHPFKYDSKRQQEALKQYPYIVLLANYYNAE